MAATAFLAAQLQAGILYVNNGDEPEQFQAINTITGSIIYTAANRGSDSPIAVRNTIWLGDNGNVNQAIEYDKTTGLPTGNTTTLTGPYLGTFIDGAASATTNYTLTAFNNNPADTASVYAAGQDWSNPVLLFTVSGGVDFVGIAFDTASSHLWISDRNNIYEYSLGGSLLSSFAHLGGYGSLAYEGETDSLWYVPNDPLASLLQYSKGGNLLRELETPERSANIFAAEFAVVPEPSACLLLLAAGAMILGRRRTAQAS